MSKLSTVLTVKSGSTTKTVNLYSSTSDMSDSTYTNEYLTCKCNGSTAYIAVASSGTDAYTNNGTALKYKNSSGTIKYILTEPYFVPYTPSYSGTITIPAQTLYTTGSVSKANDYVYDLELTWFTSASFYLNTGDKIVLNACSNAFSVREGISQYDSSTDLTTSKCTFFIRGMGSDLTWTVEGGGNGNEGDSKYASITSTTYTYNGSGGTHTIQLLTKDLELRSGGAYASINKDITLTVN